MYVRLPYFSAFNTLRRSVAHSALVFSLILSCAPALAQHDVGNRTEAVRTYSVHPIAESGVHAWRADLRTLLDELERLHPDPYHKTPEAQVDSAVATLDAAIPQLAAHEIIVEFGRLLALVGDGHTSLPLYSAHGVDFRVLPYRMGIYDDDIYVEAADRNVAEIVGGRVVAIGGVPAHEALARVAPLISRDNDNWVAAIAPFLLNRIEVLHALDLADDLGGVALTIASPGQTRTARVTPLSAAPSERLGLSFMPAYTKDWVDARDDAEAPVPLYQRRFDDFYWWEYLPEDDLLYLKWDQVQNRKTGPTALETFREAMAFARERQPARTVVDIRNNTGGEGTLGRPIIREIVRTREVDQPGKLFVVIGRRTFSAAQMLTAWFEQFTTAVLVGEPSSAFYNGYAGHDFGRLPHSGITFMVSNDYYQMGAFPGDARRQATPQLAAVPTFADYRENRDPALEAIRIYEPDALAHDVLDALAVGDTARAVEVVRTYNARPVNRFADARGRLNALGYRLIREDRIDEAVGVFALNVRLHPEYANGWDSLGEAYVQAHRREEAIAAFRRALSIQPDLAPSRHWLRRLGAEGF